MKYTKISISMIFALFLAYALVVSPAFALTVGGGNTPATGNGGDTSSPATGSGGNTSSPAVGNGGDTSSPAVGNGGDTSSPATTSGGDTSGTHSTSVASITVTSPNGGQTYALGALVPIRWTSANIVGNVRLEIVSSNLSNVINYKNLTINTGSYDLQIPVGSTPGSYVVRISASGASDTSDSSFTVSGSGAVIVPPELYPSDPITNEPAVGNGGDTSGTHSTPVASITVTSPNGGQTYTTGSNINIQWVSSNTGVSPIYMEIVSTDTGNVINYKNLTANLGNFDLLIPIGSALGNYKIRISSAGASDLSDSSFTISSSTVGNGGDTSGTSDTSTSTSTTTSTSAGSTSSGSGSVGHVGGGSGYIGGGSSSIFPFVAIANASNCSYLSSYMKFGAENDSAEVTKLQTFLKNYEKIEVDINGTFDQKTFDAVKTFQAKYVEDIMAPWGVSTPTGQVYFTTKKKINEIVCKSIEALTSEQISIIDAYKTGIQNGTIGSSTDASIKVDINNATGTDTLSPDVGSIDPAQTASIGATSVFGRIKSFIKWLFGY